MMIGSKEEYLAAIERYIKVGVTHFIFTLSRPFYPDEVQRFAEEVIPQYGRADGDAGDARAEKLARRCWRNSFSPHKRSLIY